MENDPGLVTVYADGAASPNPGPGGYGTLVVRNGVTTELSGGFRLTTNNRMELLGVIAGLESLGVGHRGHVIVCSDSRYLVDMVNGGHARAWRSRGWKLASRKKALNVDLWAQLLGLADGMDVTFEWIRGHDGHDENERCDGLAVEARRGKDLPSDEGYELAAAPVASQLTLFDIA